MPEWASGPLSTGTGMKRYERAGERPWPWGLRRALHTGRGGSRWPLALRNHWFIDKPELPETFTGTALKR